MSIRVRKNANPIEFAAAQAVNALIDAKLTTEVHRDKTSLPGTDIMLPTSSVLQVTAANASDLPTCITLANQMRSIMNVHFADSSAHLVADTVSSLAPVASDLATVITLANSLKSVYNVHGVSTTYHLNADTTIATTNASDLATSITLLNAEKTKFNSHINAGGAIQRIVLVDA